MDKVYGQDIEAGYDGAMMEVGRAAEDLWFDWARRNTKDCWEIVDVREHPRARNWKVDFSMRHREDRSRWTHIDVKSSRTIGVNGLVVGEVQRNYFRGPRYSEAAEGWLLCSKSHYLCYVNPVTRQLYYFAIDDLRAYYNANRSKYPRSKWRLIDSDNGKETFVVDMPLDAFRYWVYDL